MRFLTAADALMAALAKSEASRPHDSVYIEERPDLYPPRERRSNLYRPNGARECERRRCQMAKAAAKRT